MDKTILLETQLPGGTITSTAGASEVFADYVKIPMRDLILQELDIHFEAMVGKVVAEMMNNLVLPDYPDAPRYQDNKTTASMHRSRPDGKWQVYLGELADHISQG